MRAAGGDVGAGDRRVGRGVDDDAGEAARRLEREVERARRGAGGVAVEVAVGARARGDGAGR